MDDALWLLTSHHRYTDELTKQVKATDMGMRPNKQTGNPGRSYRFYTGQPIFKFGEGMSYTSFKHELRGPATVHARAIEAAGRSAHAGTAASLSLSSLSKTTVLTFTCNTTNTGERDGAGVIAASLREKLS